MIISKTPLRISFAGGGTDLRSYYKHNNYGAVLSTSIDSYIYVSVKKQTSLFNEKYRLNYSETELVTQLDEIKNPIIRECIRFLNINDSLYISTIGDVPASTGLGSSSTFCVGLLNALYKFKGEVASSGRLAEEAAHIECDILKRPMGKQDHYAAAYGGINYIRFYDNETVTIRPMNISQNNLKNFSESIIVFWTGMTRASESILKEQNDKNISNKEILTKIRNQALELSDILSENKFSSIDVGKLLNKGWEYKKTLASKISNNTIDEWYQKALESGAIGGKISGAGGGGFISLIVNKDNHKKVSNKLTKLGLVEYRFGLDSNGTTVSEIR
jgi:D-glycero-alpha-D-manno-heptose-7-phosphate kinase